MTRATGGPSVFTMMLTLAFLVALALLISRRRSKAALWVSLGLFVLGLPFMLWSVSRGLFVGSLVIAGAQVVGKLVAYGLLFMPDAWDWLNRRPLHAQLRDTFS
jgi:hypothetical protein